MSLKSACAAIVILGATLLAPNAGAEVSVGERLPVPGGELAVEESGEGPLVVLLHGAFMDRKMWDRQVAVLGQHFQVVRYDIRPFGESSPVETAYAPTDDLLRVLDRFGSARAHLVGHSFGGNVAVDFALAHPDRVSSLVLVGATPGGSSMPENERSAAGAVFAAIKEGDDAIVRAWIAQPMFAVSAARPALASELDAMTRRSLGTFRMAAPPFTPTTPAMDHLGEITAPTLVVVGEKDSTGVRQAAERLAHGIQGAVKKVVPGADHALPMGWAEDFNRELVAFLSALQRDPVETERVEAEPER